MKRRILIVEDNRRLLVGLLQFFEGAGFQVAGVGDFQQAEELIRRERFDCLITDLDLPGGTGLDLVSRARLFRAEMGAILITGYGCHAIRRKAEELDVIGYLEKPFDPAELLKLVRTCPVGHTA